MTFNPMAPRRRPARRWLCLSGSGAARLRTSDDIMTTFRPRPFPPSVASPPIRKFSTPKNPGRLPTRSPNVVHKLCTNAASRCADSSTPPVISSCSSSAPAQQRRMQHRSRSFPNFKQPQSFQQPPPRSAHQTFFAKTTSRRARFTSRRTAARPKQATGATSSLHRRSRTSTRPELLPSRSSSSGGRGVRSPQRRARSGSAAERAATSRLGSVLFLQHTNQTSQHPFSAARQRLMFFVGVSSFSEPRARL